MQGIVVGLLISDIKSIGEAPTASKVILQCSHRHVKFEVGIGIRSSTNITSRNTPAYPTTDYVTVCTNHYSIPAVSQPLHSCLLVL